MSPRRQILIAALAAAGVTVLFFVFVLSPKLAEMRDVRDQIAGQEQQTQRLQNELTRLEQVRRNAPRTRARLATVSEYLPSSSDLPSFIRLAQQAATRSGVDLRSIAPSAPVTLEDAEGIQVISVTLTVRGSFRRIEDLLTRLETLDRVVEVNSITLTPTRDELTGATVLDSTIQSQMYVVQPDARISGGGAGGTTVRRDTDNDATTTGGEQ